MRVKANCGLIVVIIALLSPRIIQAQGTTYVSNLGQSSAGSLSVGSDSWLAVDFVTGNNAAGYTLDSIQLAIADVSGNPSGFTAMIYERDFGNIGGAFPGSSLGTLNGSLSPTTGGIYIYTPAAIITFTPSTDYFIVLTAGTAVANGAYEWSYASAYNYNQSGGWISSGGVRTSSDGSIWGQSTAVSAQFAINATAIPEPGVLGLLGLGALGFFCHSRKTKSL